VQTASDHRRLLVTPDRASTGCERVASSDVDYSRKPPCAELDSPLQTTAKPSAVPHCTSVQAV